MIKDKISLILGEIRNVLSKINENQVDDLTGVISRSDKIVSIGAGRVGMAVRAFTMRLGHLGLTAHFLGDSTVPHIGTGDTLLVCSGSGETQTIYDLVEIAKRNGAKIALVTGNKDSKMGKLADVVVEILAPSKARMVKNISSDQPMTTLNEQCLMVFFDALVLRLMKELGETHDTMWARHSNLE